MLPVCRSYVKRAQGVPFRLQGRSLELGLDCVGLIFGALLEGGWQPEDPEFTRRKSYRLGDTARDALGELSREWDEVWLQKPQEPGQIYGPVFDVSILLPGDILACRDFSGKPGVRHLLWTDEIRPDVIVSHADTEQGKIISHGLSGLWSSQIVGVYRPFDWSDDPDPWGAK